MNELLKKVGEVVFLKKQGVNYVGLCPFHNEKTPSFIVNPKKNKFHCFGCGVDGDKEEFERLLRGETNE